MTGINMKKQLLLLSSLIPLSLSLLAVPTNCSYTAENETSVTADLTSLNYSYSSLNYDKPTLLTMALSDKNSLFVYFYVPGERSDISYYRISDIDLCDDADVDEEGEYINDTEKYDVSLVSNNDVYNINKYVVDNYSVNTTSDKSFRWYVESFEGYYSYNNNLRFDRIFNSRVEVLYDLDNLQYVTNRTKVISITDKVVAFDLVHIDAFYFGEHSYVAFNTDYKIEDLVKIDCGFDNEFIDGKTDIQRTSIVGDDFEDAFKGYSSFTAPEIKGTNSIRKYIHNSSFDYDSTYWFGSFGNRSYHWDTIQKTSELANATDEVKKYEWCVHFQTSKFMAESRKCVGVIPPITDLDSYLYNIKTVSNEDIDYASDYNSFSYVTNFEIFNLWFKENGNIKKAVVIDTPTDSSGHGQTTDPVVEDWWTKFVAWFLLDPFTHALYIVGGIIALPVLITLLPYLIKLLILIIKLPFKLISGLIKAFHK